ncbi:MAG TPA: response regulator [Vicinamibacterales bacterium]|nr:response regulator [Vicinamibacterales bacterium]
MAPLTSARRGAAARILIVEDKDSLRTMLRHALEGDGHEVVEARDQPEAVRALSEQQPVLVLSDLRLPEGDGLGVLRATKEIDDEIPVIVMTAYGSIEDAVRAMKEGALDFLAKPVDPDHLLLLVRRALEQRRIVNENLLLKEELAVRRGAPQLVGEDPSLRKVFTSLQRAAATDTTVLIEGGSGPQPHPGFIAVFGEAAVDDADREVAGAGEAPVGRLCSPNRRVTRPGNPTRNHTRIPPRAIDCTSDIQSAPGRAELWSESNRDHDRRGAAVLPAWVEPSSGEGAEAPAGA